MTTTPQGVTVLEPGSVDARDDIGLTMGGEPSLTEQLISLGFSPVEPSPQNQPTVPSEPVAHFESAALQHIQIGSLLDDRLRLREAISLEMEQENEFYIAKCDEIDEIGYGEDPISAVRDIRKTIAELYWQLKENEERLGTDLTRTWQRLSALVCEA